MPGKCEMPDHFSGQVIFDYLFRQLYFGFDRVLPLNIIFVCFCRARVLNKRCGKLPEAVTPPRRFKKPIAAVFRDIGNTEFLHTRIRKIAARI
jgi:hypothetical protein